MKLVLRVFLVFGFYCAALPKANAQDTLEVVEINTTKPIHQAFLIEVDSLQLSIYQNGTLAEALSAASGSMVRQYGPGTLSSISQRGTSAAHTAMLWNGFNLQSIMNGQYDLSLVPLLHIDELSLSQGASGARYGSGAIGGVISMNSLPQYNSGLHLKGGIQTGSFGQRRPTVSVGLGGMQFYSRTSLSFSQAANNYPFTNTTERDKPLQNQLNADFDQRVFSQDLHFRLKKNHSFSIWVLNQKTERGIPPPMTRRSASARQWDEHTRVAAAWNYHAGDHFFDLKGAFIREQIRFADTLINLDMTHQAYSKLIQGGYAWRKTWITAETRVEGSLFSGNSPGYGSALVFQNRWAVTQSIHVHPKKSSWDIQAHLRQEWIDGRAIPLIPSLQAEYRLNSLLVLGAQGSASYRVPTFNDLYWQPGGNPNLKPERGYGTDIFLALKPLRNKGAVQYFAQIGVYRQEIKQWIVWIPGDRFWTPQNELKVTNEGIQAQGRFSWITNRKHHWKYQANVQITRALLSDPQDPNFGKQLVYVPYTTATQTLSYSYKKHYLLLEHSHMGWRFTDRSNERWLPTHYLVNLSIGSTLPLHRTLALEARASLQNLFNTSYQVLAFQAMPGRMVTGSLFLHFQSKNKQL